MSVFYPIFLNLEDKTCLVVGAGKIAARKAKSLADCGARVAVVGSQIDDEMMILIKDGKVKLLAEWFDPCFLNGVTLVIGATDDSKVNTEVYDSAVKLNIPVNIVDIPELCSFYVPAVARRGDLTIAVSTSGKSPATAKRVRKQLEKQFGDEWAVYLTMMGEAREKAKRTAPDQPTRERMFNKLADSDLMDKIRNNDMDGAREIVRRIVGR